MLLGQVVASVQQQLNHIWVVALDRLAKTLVLTGGVAGEQVWRSIEQ
jgi:hypothetical protein